jgi:hypothetical protein
MRLLIAAAVGLVAAVTPTASATPRTETLYARAGGPIAAFAQDGSLISWFAPRERSCNRVHMVSLVNPLKTVLPLQGGARNVTCRWNAIKPVWLAVASSASQVLWTLREDAPLPFDYLVGAGAGDKTDRTERRYQEIAHTKRGAGLWLGGVAGDGAALVYGVTSVDYADEAGCLAGTGSCEMQMEGGGVYRVVGRETPKLIDGTDAAVTVAASGSTVAYVPAATVAKDGRPFAGADLPIEVVDIDGGGSIASVQPQGTPLAIALAPNTLATVERTPVGLRLAWYDSATGTPTGSVPLPDAASPEVSTNDRVAVYRIGRNLHSVDLATTRDTLIGRTAAAPIGLSLEGNRLAWAENVKSGGRIRALYLPKG